MSAIERNVVSHGGLSYAIWNYANELCQCRNLDKSRLTPMEVVEPEYRLITATRYAKRWGEEQGWSEWDKHSKDPQTGEYYPEWEIRVSGTNEQIGVHLVLGEHEHIEWDTEDGGIDSYAKFEEKKRVVLRRATIDEWILEWAQKRNEKLTKVQNSVDQAKPWERQTMLKGLKEQGYLHEYNWWKAEPVESLTPELLRHLAFDFGIAQYHGLNLNIPLEQWELRGSPDWNGQALHI